jgi:hypothetical protein
VTKCASLPRLSRHPFHGGLSGSLLEFPPSRLVNREASVSSSFPSQDAGWGPAATANVAEAHSVT